MENKNYIPNFKVPEDYFNNFEDRLFTKIEEESLPKASGFSVPEGYFAQVEQRIITATKSEKSTKVIPLFSKRNLSYIAGIAASLIIAISLFNKEQEQITIDNIQLSAIDKYIDDGNLNLDLYDLMSYLNDSDLSQIDFDLIALSSKDIEGYLKDNTDENFWFDDSLDDY